MILKKSSLVAITAAVLVGLIGCSTPAEGESGEDVTLVWAGTGGDTEVREAAAFQAPFTEKTGIKVENVAFVNLIAQLQKMVEAGDPEWDIFHNVPYIALKYCGDLLEEVDYSDLPDVFPEGTTTDCTRPLGKFAFAFAYDTEVYSDTVPTSIEDFFDTEKFPGKRVIRGNNPRAYLEAALVADGVDPQSLYPLDVDRALAKFDTIKSDLLFVPSVSAIQQALVNKQATMTMTINSNLGATLDSGGTIAPVWDVTFWDFDVLMIPKGTPNLEEAAELVKFSLEPEQLIENARLGGNMPVRTDVDIESIEFEGTTDFNPFFGSDRGELVLMNTEWWADNLESTSEAWVAWQAG